MEERVDSIIEQLDSHDATELDGGLNDLDTLLFGLLPEIEQSRRGGALGPSNELQQFLRVQEGIEYNIVSYLVKVYKVVWGEFDSESCERLFKCNRLLQGLLLLHHESRSVFHRPSNMRLLLRYLAVENSSEDGDVPTIPVELTISFISTIIYVLLKDLKNIRVFEDCDGCSILIRKLRFNSVLDSSFKASSGTSSDSQTLNFKIIEFLIFYFVDESTLDPIDCSIKTTSEKIELFKAEYPEIGNLVKSFDELKTL